MKKLIPSFLQRVDLYLLVHFPFVWATRIHFFIFYSLICVNLIFMLIGYLYPISIENFPDHDTIVVISYIWLITVFMIIIVWVFLQINASKPIFTLRQMLVTFICYILCLTSPLINIFILNNTIKKRIVGLVEMDRLHEDYFYYLSNTDLIDSLNVGTNYFNTFLQGADTTSSSNSSLKFPNKFKALEVDEVFILQQWMMKRLLQNFEDQIYATIGGNNLYNPFRYFERSLLSSEVVKIDSLAKNLQTTPIVKHSLLNDLKEWDRLRIQYRFEFPLLKYCVLNNDEVLKIMNKYGVGSSIIGFEKKIRNLLSYQGSTFCCFYGSYYDFESRFRSIYMYKDELDTPFHMISYIPQKEKLLFISLPFLVFSIAIFTIVLRNYKQNTIWIALLTGVVFFYFIGAGSEALQPGSASDEIFLLIYLIFLTLSFPLLINAYISKKNKKWINVYLLIPLLAIFFWHFILGFVMLVDPSLSYVKDFFKTYSLSFIFFFGSIVYSLVCYYALIRVNRLPS